MGMFDLLTVVHHCILQLSNSALYFEKLCQSSLIQNMNCFPNRKAKWIAELLVTYAEELIWFNSEHNMV